MAVVVFNSWQNKKLGQIVAAVVAVLICVLYCQMVELFFSSHSGRYVFN